ncbi:TPR repeat region-containing protein [Nocardiopsis terrae]
MQFNPKECDVDDGQLDAAGEEMLNLVARISGMSGDMEAHFNNSAKEFSELIAEDIRSTASDNQGAWGDALTACWHIFGVCKKWSGEVDRYRQNIRGLQEEWDAAVSSNFGYTDPDDVGILTSQAAKAEALTTQANTYWETLEGQAEDNTSNIEGGPTIANLRELIDAGVLGFAIYNSTRQLMYYPSTEGNGEEHAEDLLEYVEGDKEPDAHYYHLLAQLSIINGLALDGQRNGNELRPDQIDYLEEFYTSLEENSEDGTVTGVIDLINQSETLDGERDELTEALGGGILALSDGNLGGGYDRLPESVRMVAEGPSDYWIPDAKSSRTSEEDAANTHWRINAELLGDLLQSAPNLEGQPMQGGIAFSAHTTVTISEFLENDTDGEGIYSEQLAPLLDVSTRNPEANAVLLTGETTNGNEYVHPNHGSVELSDTLENLYTYDWHDNGATVAQLTDWIPEYSDSDDPEQRTLAGESTSKLVEALTEDNELYLRLVGVEMEENDGVLAAVNEDEPKISFTELNPELAASFFEVYHNYIEDFGGTTDGVYEYNTDREHLNLPVDARVKFMQYIAGDEESAVRMIAATEGHQMMNLSFDNLDPESPSTAGSENGTLQAILDSALQNEAMNRTANADEAAESTAERQRKAAMFITEVALGVAKVPASTTPGSAVGAEILAASIKDGVQADVDANIKAEIGDFAEAKGNGFTSEQDARLNASLHLIRELVESEDSDLTVSDIDDLALTEANDGSPRVASGVHEVYSRDLSTVDSRIDSNLKENDIILNPSEIDEDPSADPVTIGADEFIETYTRNHREQYDYITEQNRARTPQEIIDMVAR